MPKIAIDLQHDPEVPAGRSILESLVGAHMAADTEEELLTFVRHSMDPVFSAPLDQAFRLMTHATYRGQALIVRLLDVATRQRMALLEAGLDPDHHGDDDHFTDERLAIWTELRQDLASWDD